MFIFVIIIVIIIIIIIILNAYHHYHCHHHHHHHPPTDFASDRKVIQIRCHCQQRQIHHFRVVCLCVCVYLWFFVCLEVVLFSIYFFYPFVFDSIHIFCTFFSFFRINFFIGIFFYFKNFLSRYFTYILGFL